MDEIMAMEDIEIKWDSREIEMLMLQKKDNNF